MLGNWLSEALSSRTKTKILRLISSYPTKEFTGREMATLIGVSHRSVDLAMKELVALDILNVRGIGRANVYVANRESYRFKTLGDLFGREAGTKQKIIEAIREALPGVLSCVLFGSVAKAEERTGSDVDLLIVADNPKALKQGLERLGAILSKEFSVLAAPVVLTPAQLRKKWRAPYVVSARKEGVLISGMSLDEIHAGSS